MIAHPDTLRSLVERYETLLDDAPDGNHSSQVLADAVYTLCVSTGTRDIETALTVAREHIDVSRPQNQSAA